MIEPHIVPFKGSPITEPHGLKEPSTLNPVFPYEPFLNRIIPYEPLADPFTEALEDPPRSLKGALKRTRIDPPKGAPFKGAHRRPPSAWPSPWRGRAWRAAEPCTALGARRHPLKGSYKGSYKGSL